MTLGCKPQQCAMEVKETLTCIMCKTKCLKSHFTLVLGPSWDQALLIFNLAGQKGKYTINVLRNWVNISSTIRTFYANGHLSCHLT